MGISIVLRFNNSGLAKYTQDPIQEHKLILNKNGTVGFGKIGKPLSDTTFTQIEFQISQKLPAYLFLLTKKTKHRDYSCFRCKIASIKKNKAALTAPSYYEYIKNDFGTWFELSTIEEYNHSALSDLYLASSGKSVMDALRSMSSMFVINTP